MKKFFLVALLSSGMLVADNQNGSVLPTDRVMRVLAKSGTLYRGSQDWQKDLQKDGASVATVYAAMRFHNDREEMVGLAARAIPLRCFEPYVRFTGKFDNIVFEGSTTAANFSIERHGDVITIESKFDEEQAEDINSNMTVGGISTTVKAEDNYTVCESFSQSSLEKKSSLYNRNSTIRTNSRSSCKTVIPYLVFLAQLEYTKPFVSIPAPHLPPLGK